MPYDNDVCPLPGQASGTIKRPGLPAVGKVIPGFGTAAAVEPASRLLSIPG